MIENIFYCAYCMKKNEIIIDPTEGYKQSIEEECEFCDHVNFLEITIEPDTMDSEVESRVEE